MKYFILLSLVVAVVYCGEEDTDDQYFEVPWDKYHDKIATAVETTNSTKISDKAKEFEDCKVKEGNETEVKYAVGNAFNQDFDFTSKDLGFNITIHTLVIEVRCPASDKGEVKFYAQFTYTLPDTINTENFKTYDSPKEVTNKHLRKLMEKAAEEPAGSASNYVAASATLLLLSYFL